MKKLVSGGRIVAVAAIVALAAGCSGAQTSSARSADPRNPIVTVTKGAISIDQNRIRFRKAEGAVVIVWRFSKETPASVRFLANGIEFKNGAEQFDCSLIAQGRAFQCLNKNTQLGEFKYDINVIDGSTPIRLDPLVTNDE